MSGGGEWKTPPDFALRPPPPRTAGWRRPGSPDLPHRPVPAAPRLGHPMVCSAPLPGTPMSQAPCVATPPHPGYPASRHPTSRTPKSRHPVSQPRLGRRPREPAGGAQRVTFRSEPAGGPARPARPPAGRANCPRGSRRERPGSTGARAPLQGRGRRRLTFLGGVHLVWGAAVTQPRGARDPAEPRGPKGKAGGRRGGGGRGRGPGRCVRSGARGSQTRARGRGTAADRKRAPGRGRGARPGDGAWAGRAAEKAGRWSARRHIRRALSLAPGCGGGCEGQPGGEGCAGRGLKAEEAPRGGAACSGTKERGAAGASAANRPRARAGVRDKGPSLGYPTATPDRPRNRHFWFRSRVGSEARLKELQKLRGQKTSTQVTRIPPGEAYAIDWKDHVFTPEG